MTVVGGKFGLGSPAHAKPHAKKEWGEMRWGAICLSSSALISDIITPPFSSFFSTLISTPLLTDSLSHSEFPGGFFWRHLMSGTLFFCRLHAHTLFCHCITDEDAYLCVQSGLTWGKKKKEELVLGDCCGYTVKEEEGRGERGRGRGQRPGAWIQRTIDDSGGTEAYIRQCTGQCTQCTYVRSIPGRHPAPAKKGSKGKVIFTSRTVLPTSGLSPRQRWNKVFRVFCRERTSVNDFFVARKREKE